MPDAPGVYGDVWGSSDDGDANPETDAQTAESAEGTESYEDIDPGLASYLERKLAEREAALVEAIEKGDPTSKVYKGLQRRLNERDQVIKQLEAELRATREAQQDVARQVGGVREGVQWLTDTTLGALDDETRGKAVSTLQERRLAIMQREMEEAMRATTAQTYQRPAAAGNDSEFEAVLASARREFVEGRRKTAQRFKVDPETLDYGGDDEPFNVRQEKFEESLARAIENAAVAGVRATGNREPTRLSGGVAAGGGDLSLEEASMRRIREMMSGKYS